MLEDEEHTEWYINIMFLHWQLHKQILLSAGWWVYALCTSRLLWPIYLFIIFGVLLYIFVLIYQLWLMACRCGLTVSIHWSQLWLMSCRCGLTVSIRWSQLWLMACITVSIHWFQLWLMACRCRLTVSIRWSQLWLMVCGCGLTVSIHWSQIWLMACRCGLTVSIHWSQSVDSFSTAIQRTTLQKWNSQHSVQLTWCLALSQVLIRCYR